jgi:hypothetical protein
LPIRVGDGRARRNAVVHEMTRKLTTQEVCGIPLSAFTNQPTPAELGAIIARWDSEDQALFLISLGEQLRFSCSHEKYGIQLAYIRQALAAQEEVLCTGYGSELIENLTPCPDEAQP